MSAQRDRHFLFTAMDGLKTPDFLPTKGSGSPCLCCLDFSGWQQAESRSDELMACYAGAGKEKKRKESIYEKGAALRGETSIAHASRRRTAAPGAQHARPRGEHQNDSTKGRLLRASPGCTELRASKIRDSCWM